MRRKPIYHIETKNLSFLKMAKDLKVLGVKNNMFFLKLYDPDLKYVDPHAPNLSQDMIIKITTECMINPWYFLREVVRIPDSGAGGIPYILNRANLASTYCFLQGIDHYLVIPRQTGKTQSTVAILLWAFILGATNSEFFFVNIDQEQAKNNLRRLKAQRDLLPPYLQFKVSLTDDGKLGKQIDNANRLENKTNRNSIVTAPSARSKEKADSIGRGRTQPIHYYDEVEFTDWIKVIVEAAGPAYAKAAMNAEKNGSAHCRIFTTTPGDLDSRACSQAVEIVKKTVKMSEKIYDWSKEEINEYVNTGNGIIYIEYNYKQLGLSESWFKETCRTVNNDPLKIKREILLQRMRGSASSPFDPADLEALQSLRGTVAEELFIAKVYRIDIYTPLERNKVYIIGLDPSGGGGGDNTAFTILDPYTLTVVASFKSPLIGAHALQNLLRTLIRKYIPNAILCIERNYGEALLDNLRNSDISRNLYFDNAKDLLGSNIDAKLDAQGYLKHEAASRRFYGVWTGSKSRKDMFKLLYTHVSEYKDKIVSNDIIDDILGLIKNPRGKIEAGPGHHDDCVMSYLIALYVYYYGNNLQRFGFVRGGLPDEEQRNQGLTYEETLSQMDDQTRSYFEGVSYQDNSDYDRKLSEEIERVRMEMNMYRDNGAINHYENLDYDTNTSFDTSFFEMLND